MRLITVRHPIEWRMVTLQDIAAPVKHSIKRGPWGGSLKKEFFVRSGYKVYEQKNVIYDDFTTGDYYIDDNKFFELKDFEISPGDILISCSGTYGKVAIVPQKLEKGIINQALLKISVNEKEILVPYFKYLLQSEPVQNYFFGLTHGSAIKNVVSVSILKKMEFALPPISEQDKIISILSKVDELIEKTDQIIEQTQRLKKGLMQSVLVKGIGHQGYKPVRFGPLFLKYKIPKKWQVRTLEHCVRSDVPITYGIVQAGPNVLGGIPYIRTGDMSGGRLSKDGMLHTSVKIASSFHRSQVKAGEIVCALRGIVGKVLEVPEELEGANLTQGTARISPRHDIYRRYLLWALRSEYARRQFEVFSKGTTLEEITLGQLRTIKVAVPVDIKEQVELATIFDQLELVIDLRQRYKEKLVILKAGLMQKLLTGKLRVKV